jgi:leucyl aminopeptidase
VNLFEGVTHPGGATGAVDRALGGQITSLIAAGEIKGKLGEAPVIHSAGRVPAARVIVAGLGKRENFGVETVHKAVGASVRAAKKRRCGRIATILHGAGIAGMETERSSQAVVEGAFIGDFEPDAYKTSERETEIESLIIIEREADKAKQAEKAAAVGEIIAREMNRARSLVNMPANELSPSDFAREAQRRAEELGLGCQVLGGDQLEKQGFGLITAVGRGSERPPQLAIIRRQPKKRGPVIALVGKGITFDSGGLSLKPAEQMELMKGDMAGAAAVLCAVCAIAQLKVGANVMALMPLADNMPGGRATRPGDVIKSYGGKTVEITNTDAEGRLILADALAFAAKNGATHIVDVATLTGAMVIALGKITTGILGNDEELLGRVKAAAEKAGERVWEMPLFDEYGEQIKSPIADMKNVGGRPAGPITAAMFLKEFVGETPWVHLDIAGTSWNENRLPHMAKGPTGVAVRTLVELCRDFP